MMIKKSSKTSSARNKRANEHHKQDTNISASNIKSTGDELKNSLTQLLNSSHSTQESTNTGSKFVSIPQDDTWVEV